MLKKEEKHKIIVIPVSRAGDKPYFLTVRDRRHKEWIFITGGCRKKEISYPLKSALRELEEETRGVINIKSGTYSEFSFKVKNHTQEEIEEDTKKGIEVILVYHVYVIDYNISRQRQLDLVEQFDKEKMKMDERKRAKLSIRRTYDENDSMSFDTLNEFNKKKKWKFITDNVLNNPDFMIAVNTLNRKYFNVK